mmetsp:Transcript_11983/g.21087  ORF Transcript_11983/g.21087 Transcript_11983/m.21087 type:complete len:558 (+) Transcript_11983:66-1739(+)
MSEDEDVKDSHQEDEKKRGLDDSTRSTMTEDTDDGKNHEKGVGLQTKKRKAEVEDDDDEGTGKPSSNNVAEQDRSGGDDNESLEPANKRQKVQNDDGNKGTSTHDKDCGENAATKDTTINGDKAETAVNKDDDGDKMDVDGGTEDSQKSATRKENDSNNERASKLPKESGDDDRGTRENATAEKEDSSTPAQPQRQESKANPYASIKYTMITNDGKPESLIKLVALKSLFAKQLPKMPRPYIARLVFDRRHTSLAILNDDPATKDTDEEVIGAICYRPFYDMRFAEIAFCAVNASHQVKGYGTKLMNLVKQQGARTGIEYFITYADNYAIGYFKKQGFTKSIAMPKGRYQGLIKDYDGGTMMECYVHPSIDFTRIPEMLAAQREFILGRIRLKAQSTKVYDPLPKNWSPNLEGVSRANEAAARALAIPGMVEAGWTMADLLAATGQGKDLDRAKNALKSELLGIVRKVEEQQFSWPFREPVDTNEVKDYLEVIKEPIDLSTIDKRIRAGDHYKSKGMLYADLMLMVNNCKLYNDETSTYVQCAVNLESYLKNHLFAK